MNFELKDIISGEIQAKIQDSLTHATGFGVAFVDKAGRHMGDCTNFCRFCSAINEIEAGQKACECSNMMAIDVSLENHKSSVYLCHAGLLSFVIPMFYEDEFIGAFTAGQVRCDDIEVPQYMEAPQAWLDDPLLREYFDEIPVFSRQQVEGAGVAFRSITNYILQQVAFNKIEQELLEIETRKLQLEHQLKVAELNALQKQVTPHFIFNVLSGISRLLDSGDYDVAQEMLSAFTHMMRYTLYDATTTVSLKQELGYVQNYLTIQRIRFGERIRYTIDCPKSLHEVQVPFFSLQPLIENAIEHGLLPCADGGEVNVRCRRHGNGIKISVRDNGVGIPADKLEDIRRSIMPGVAQGLTDRVGLYNSSRRFSYLYEDKTCFSLVSTEGKGSTVRISISEPIGLQVK